MEELAGQPLPIPTLLPVGYSIQEVFISQHVNSKPLVTHILLFISDKQVVWAGNRYSCPMVIDLGWNQIGAGFKHLEGHIVPPYPGIPEGVIQKHETEWVMWWQNYSSPNSQSVLEMHASLQFSKEQLFAIAASTPTTTRR
jgi:hypothetical protein